jgi:hypothetical protein
MKLSFQKIALFCGIATLSVGLVTSLSSFNRTTSSLATTTGSNATCYQDEEADCAPNVSYTMTVNGTAVSNATVSTGKNSSSFSLGIPGLFTISLPIKVGTSNTSVGSTNGFSYTVVYSSTSRRKANCVTGSASCIQKDCDRTVVDQTSYRCTNVNP